MAEDGLVTAADTAHPLDGQLRVALDMVPALMWIANRDGAMVHLNQQWLHYTGLLHEQAVGWGWACAVHPDDVTSLTESWRALVDSGTQAEIEARLRRADGERRWFLLRAAPVRDASGAVAGWCGTHVDIDDRVRAREHQSVDYDWRMTLDTIPGLASTATPGGEGWTTLIDGEKGMENFNQIGQANWRAEGGAIVADKGKGGHLVSKKSYRNFELYAEFWANEDTQSGIFFRISDPKKVGAASAYEANIYDKRPGQEYRTGAIVNHARVPVPTVFKTNGGWNTYLITADGPELTVMLNGEVTVHVRDTTHKEGPISLQFGNRGKEPGGAIKWRKVEIKEL